MKDIISRVKKAFSKDDVEPEEAEEEYIELDTHSGNELKSKIIVRSYVIDDFSDVKQILDALREGYTIALVNIKPLKEKDDVELRRAISKLKKTVDAIEGDIAGFGDDWIVATPSLAEIFRTKDSTSIPSTNPPGAADSDE